MAKKLKDDCGLAFSFSIIGGKWKPLLLWELSKGTLRYGELKKRVKGISEKMLINQLRELQADGIITRKSFPEVPPRVEYEITNTGKELNNALLPLSKWGKRYQEKLGAG